VKPGDVIKVGAKPSSQQLVAPHDRPHPGDARWWTGSSVDKDKLEATVSRIPERETSTRSSTSSSSSSFTPADPHGSLSQRANLLPPRLRHRCRQPDQRISEDVRAFTTTTLSFLLLILNGTVTAVSFSGVLWSISPFLFTVAVVYAVCGTALTVLLGKPLIRLNYHQLDMEANFRADLIHVRENSESIALAHREGRFKARLRTPPRRARRKLPPAHPHQPQPRVFHQRI
jgi:hypothetical protein